MRLLALLPLLLAGCATSSPCIDPRCVGSYSADLGRHIDLCRGVVEYSPARILAPSPSEQERLRREARKVERVP